MPMDYYPLLTAAVSTLEQNTAEARRGVYDRARRVLAPDVPTPFVSGNRLKEELLALEIAIRRVEAEAAGFQLVAGQGGSEKSASYRPVAQDTPGHEPRNRSLFQRVAVRVVLAAAILVLAAAAYTVATGLADMSWMSEWNLDALLK